MKLFGSMEVRDQELIIGGVRASNLVKEYGTPLYVMDEKLLRDTCNEYYKNFKCDEEGNRVAFAGKAFLTVEMAKLIKEEGLCLDVVSGGELYTAYKAGVPMERIYFHGNNKTLDEIELGVKLGVGRFIVDNLYEMEYLDKFAKEYGKVQDIYLRITPGIEAHTHDYIKTGQIDSKFGFAPVGDIIMSAIKKAISLENINLSGLHCHIGSQIFELEPFEDAAEVMLNLINKIKNETGNAGLTLYKVGAIKDIPKVRKYVSVDGGMVDNIRPALYDAKYECCIANKMNEDCIEKVTIAGKCCESGDILIKDTMLPVCETGDILAIMSTGAYGYSMSNNYNKIPKAAVVMTMEGNSRVVAKRESYEDLIKNEIN